MSIESKTARPSTLIEAIPTLVIPKFQRAYCWSPKQETAQLIDDLISNIQVDSSSAAIQTPEYYIGQILIKKDSYGSIHNLVVDGQQRLTTLWFIYKILWQKLHATSSNDLGATAIEEKLKGIIWNGDKPRLKSQQYPTDFSCYFQQNNNSYDDENSPFHETYVFLSKRLDPAAIKSRNAALSNHNISLKDVLIAMANQCINIVFTLTICKTSEAVNHVFETLNYRGKPLDQYDLIMNSLYLESETTEQVRDSFTLVWEKMAEIHNDRSFPPMDVFARHCLETFIGKTIGKKRIYSAFKKWSRTNANYQYAVFSENLKEFAIWYQRVAKPALLSVDKNHDYLIRLLSFLQTLRLEMARPALAALMRYYDSHTNDAYKVCKFGLEFLCVFHLFFTGIYSKRTNSVAKNYRDLAHKIYYSRNSQDIRLAFDKFKESVRGKLPEESELKAKLDALKYDAKTSKDPAVIKENACSMFTLRLISKSMDKAKSFDQSLSAEHVFDNDHEKRIMYIVPLSEAMNNQIPKGIELKERIEVYAKSNYAYTNKLANEIIDSNDFAEEHVREALEKAFNNAKEIVLQVLRP